MALLLSDHRRWETGLMQVHVHEGYIHSLLFLGTINCGPHSLEMQTVLECLRRGLPRTRKPRPYSPAVPLLGLPVWNCSLTRNVLVVWERAEITVLGDLFSGSILMSFQELQEQYGIQGDLPDLQRHKMSVDHALGC